MTRIILAAIVLLFVTALVVGGVWRISLGGTWGYLALVLLMAFSGLLLFERRRSGVAVHGHSILFARTWGVWEIGIIYWWRLVSRGGVLVRGAHPPTVNPRLSPTQGVAGGNVSSSRRGGQRIRRNETGSCRDRLCSFRKLSARRGSIQC